MKKNFKQALKLTTFCILGFSSLVKGQSVYKITASKDIDMRLSGTSTLHKWTMDAKTFSGDATFNFKAAELSSVKALTFALAVADLKGSENGLNKNAYKALKSNQYKDITYKLVSATITSRGADKYLIRSHGNLTIAGVTKEIVMDVHSEVNKDGTITCTGSEKLNMTDYSVKPPTFMLGAMKTGDAITLDFKLVYTKDTSI